MCLLILLEMTLKRHKQRVFSRLGGGVGGGGRQAPLNLANGDLRSTTVRVRATESTLAVPLRRQAERAKTVKSPTSLKAKALCVCRRPNVFIICCQSTRRRAAVGVNPIAGCREAESCESSGRRKHDVSTAMTAGIQENFFSNLRVDTVCMQMRQVFIIRQKALKT